MDNSMDITAALRHWQNDKKWFVTSPRKNSNVNDICFLASPGYLVNQINGGLKNDEILRVFDCDKADEAKDYAQHIIDVVNMDNVEGKE